LENLLDFFREKKAWSKYKDLILDYYLEPYLHKVKQLRKPILVVDCFAGPGKFDDGEPGSPFIISRKLHKLHQLSFDVLCLCIEKNPILYDRLIHNIQSSPAPTAARLGSFRDYIDEIADLAKNHTVFVYLDPIRPSDLFFNDLQSVYDQLKHGQSVETLVNFMTTSFLRAVRGFANRILLQGTLQLDHPLVIKWNKIAGGTYWHDVAFNPSFTENQRADRLAEGYVKQLHRWFDWVIPYPIREKYKHVSPKYHLIFGSRYPGALELMNRAMVTARREFIKAGFIQGFLFPNQPDKEVIRPEEIRKMVIRTSLKLGNATWTQLRINATLANPCLYTDSEFNRAIKQAIRERLLLSDCTGKKIEEDALIWPPA
jgi:three-Cys-motif partner protein